MPLWIESHSVTASDTAESGKACGMSLATTLSARGLTRAVTSVTASDTEDRSVMAVHGSRSRLRTREILKLRAGTR
jgi:hypothetical protein